MEKVKKFSRRDFLKMGTGTLAATVAATAVPAKVLAQEKLKNRYAMILDLNKCTGCHACTVACKAEFAVPLGNNRSWVETKESGEFPQTKREMLPRLCNHCGDPPCVPVCPADATHQYDNGTVFIEPEKCIGCGACVDACPYHARYLTPEIDPAKNPKNVVAEKCEYCLHRIENGVVPSCVNTCPAKVRVFGDLKDPTSDAAKLLAANKNNYFVLEPELGTEPHAFYIKKRS